jgi:hypothetical protein
MRTLADNVRRRRGMVAAREGMAPGGGGGAVAVAAGAGATDVHRGLWGGESGAGRAMSAARVFR